MPEGAVRVSNSAMKPQRPSPTLHDVASAAGVSTATVSRCLNFPDQVAERTRKKVMEAVGNLGYSPNFGARAMASRRTNTIGAIIPTMENAIFARGLQAFQEELRRHGFTMLVASSSYKKDLEEEQIRSLVARGADALLLIGHERDQAIYDFLDAQGVPSLVTWAFDRNKPRPSIGFDNHAAMKAMAEQVIKLGHDDLALITAEVRSNDRAQARLDGLRAAASDAGIAPDRLRVVHTTYGIEEGGIAMQELMQQERPPTAVFCGNDVLAVGALNRARDLGIAVPDDVSIIGFDDIELAQVAFPPLATVHVPHRDMGRIAAQSLVRMVKGESLSGSVELEAKLTLRASLGARKPR